MMENFSPKMRIKMLRMWFYRHVCGWKAHQVEEHWVHDAAHFYGRLAVPHRRLGKCRIEENAVRVQLLEHSLPQLSAFLDVIIFLRRSDHAAGGVQGKEEKSIERVLGATDYRFSQLAPQIFGLLLAEQGRESLKRLRVFVLQCYNVDTVTDRGEI